MFKIGRQSSEFTGFIFQIHMIHFQIMMTFVSRQAYPPFEKPCEIQMLFMKWLISFSEIYVNQRQPEYSLNKY